MSKKSKELGLSELISRIKQDLMSDVAHDRDKTTLFSVDELTLEVNFVVTGDVESGFDIGVVSLGSQVSEERIQKVTIKMTPLLTRGEIIKDIKKDGMWDALKKSSRPALLKGDILKPDENID